jgi:hypothetical protein
MDLKLDGLFTILIGAGVLIGIVVGSIIYGIVYFVSDDCGVIKVSEPIEPKIELFVTEDNKVDTLYVYEKKDKN